MFQSFSRRAVQIGLGFLLIASFNQALAQENSIARLANSDSRSENAKPESKDPGRAASILASFTAAENKVREALNQHTFKRDVVLQTIGPNGEVTGEYIRNSQFLFDDRGRRIEKVLFHPASTIREMRITKEDIQDLAGSQLLGIDIVEATKYRLSYVGLETIDSRQLLAIDVAPLTEPDPKHMSERYFVGRVWVDPTSFQILKIKGIVEPQGKQRFPIFETWREPAKNTLAFPTRTEADDILHFAERDVHYRIRVRYYEYKQFGSKVSITEVDAPFDDVDEVTPKGNEAPPKMNEAPPRINQASPKLRKSQPNLREKSTSQLALPKIQSQGKPEVCTTNRNAPPIGGYHWPADSEVKVYFVRDMFSPEQSATLLEAMRTWTISGQGVGSGVKFVYSGETETRMSCRGCLTVGRRDVYKRDKHHYAFFNPMQEEGGRLVSAWIDLDVGIKDPNALQGFMAHELGHGLGLWDCPSCKKKQSLMNSFPGLNQNNGLVAPSTCDLATMKSVYQEERQVASAKGYVDKRPQVELNATGETETNTSRVDTGVSVHGVQDSTSDLTSAIKPLAAKLPGTSRLDGASPLTAPRQNKSSFYMFDLHHPRVNRSLFLWDRKF